MILLPQTLVIFFWFHFKALNLDERSLYLRNEGYDDEMPRAKGPTTRAMARRIQGEWALNAHARYKMNFTWAKEDVKT